MNVVTSQRQMLKTYLYWWVLVCVFLSCDTQSEEEIYLDGLRNIEFECFQSSGEYYVHGAVLDDSICVFPGENEYRAFFGIGTKFVTLDPNFSSGEIPNHESSAVIDMGVYKKSDITGFLDEIRVTGPPQEYGTSLDSMVKVFLIEGIHTIRENVSGVISTDGFEVLLNKWYYNPAIYPKAKSIAFSSALGCQPEESHLTIKDIFLSRTGELVTGFIEFNVSCKLFFRNATVHLNGEFATNFEAEFRLPISYQIE